MTCSETEGDNNVSRQQWIDDMCLRCAEEGNGQRKKIMEVLNREGDVFKLLFADPSFLSSEFCLQWLSGVFQHGTTEPSITDWWWLFPRLRAFWENVRPVIPRLRFFSFF